MKRRALRQAIRAELERDYWQSGREMYERLQPGVTVYCFKGYLTDERKRVHPDIDDTPDPRWVGRDRYTPPAGTDSERASDWIRNDLYRQRWQISTILIERCKAAGYGCEEWSQGYWVSIVTQARIDTGRELTVQQAAWLRSAYGGSLDNARRRRKLRNGRESGRNKPRIDIHAPPPTPGKNDPDNARRFAADVLRSAIDDADRLLDRLSNAETSRRITHAKHSAAWLQSPEATEVYCGIADIDADDLAEWSRQRHGVPRFSEAELAYWRDQRRTYEQQRDKERSA